MIGDVDQFKNKKIINKEFTPYLSIPSFIAVFSSTLPVTLKPLSFWNSLIDLNVQLLNLPSTFK